MYDAVVVGIGGVGSFALRALGRRGCKVLGVERYSRLHPHGSSHGYTRIYRRAYFEHPSYVPWIEFSIREFRDLQNEYKTPLMQECGTIIMEPADAAVGGKFPPLCQASYDSAQQHGITVECFDSRELSERFPQFNYKHSMVGILEPQGGFLRPERIINYTLTDALRNSPKASLKDNTIVESFQHIDASIIEMKLRNRATEEVDVVQTKCILVSAGAWTGQIIPSWKDYLKPLRQIQGWIDVSKTQTPEDYNYEHMPTFVFVTPDSKLPLYGVPCDKDDPQHRYWLKAGIHGREAFLQNPSNNPTTVSDDERKESGQALVHALNADLCGSDYPRYAEAVPCIYTMTPDTNFIIGTPKEMNNIFCVAGLSGHGFKMTPALGEMMADYATGQNMEHWKQDFCSPARFGI